MRLWARSHLNSHNLAHKTNTELYGYVCHTGMVKWKEKWKCACDVLSRVWGVHLVLNSATVLSSPSFWNNPYGDGRMGFLAYHDYDNTHTWAELIWCPSSVADNFMNYARENHPHFLDGKSNTQQVKVACTAWQAEFATKRRSWTSHSFCPFISEFFPATSLQCWLQFVFTVNQFQRTPGLWMIETTKAGSMGVIHTMPKNLFRCPPGV